MLKGVMRIRIAITISRVVNREVGAHLLRLESPRLGFYMRGCAKNCPQWTVGAREGFWALNLKSCDLQVLSMPLVGALFNHLEQLSRLDGLRRKLLRKATHSPRPATQVKLRAGKIQTTIIEVLVASSKPLPVAEIHAAVERILSMPIPKGTVNSFLSVESRGPKARFERIELGVYRMLKP
ncbi:MAG TPA: hypothetical protein VF245_02495 [Solirubrobacterales bacterium]